MRAIELTTAKHPERNNLLKYVELLHLITVHLHGISILTLATKASLVYPFPGLPISDWGGGGGRS